MKYNLTSYFRRRFKDSKGQMVLFGIPNSSDPQVLSSGGIGITKGLDGNGYLNAAFLNFSQTGIAMLDAANDCPKNAQTDMRLKSKG